MNSWRNFNLCGNFRFTLYDSHHSWQTGKSGNPYNQREENHYGENHAHSGQESAFLAGKRSFRIFGITITIRHAHDNEYQVLLPDEDEIIRIVDRGNGRLRAFVV